MNKNIKLAVAGAVLALSATAANAGIVIPAGEWTVDIGGNVNTYATWTRQTGSATMQGSYNYWAGANDTSTRTDSNITTGLLPNYLSVSGSTRQNDLDVGFTISIQPGASSKAHSSVGASGGQNAKQENRQAFMTFGDKSWGSFKLGRDIGVFASDAILNDMTLLGVGGGAGVLAGNTTTLGRIGSGFIYADWKSQVAYTTPNFNGFQATVALTQGWNQEGDTTISATSNGRSGAAPAYEGKASYSFAANDVTGKVWVSGISQQVRGASVHLEDNTAWGADIGANVNFAGFGLTGYYYHGEGLGTQFQMTDGYDTLGKRRESDGGYVQATYILPTKTKLGASWGVSSFDRTSNDATTLMKDSEMWAVGLYHPLTKHLNLVAEYTRNTQENHAGAENRAQTGSLGAQRFIVLLGK